MVLVVIAADAGTDAGQVGAVDVDRDGGDVADVADPVDVAWRRKAAYVAGIVVSYAELAELLVEQFLVFDALDDAEYAPADVVVDSGDLAGSPDQGDDGERAVRFDVQYVGAVPIRVTQLLGGGEDVRSGKCCRSWSATSCAVSVSSFCVLIVLRMPDTRLSSCEVGAMVTVMTSSSLRRRAPVASCYRRWIG
jgi:hypothetical protein